MSKRSKVVYLPDAHVPFHDSKAIAAALDFVRSYKPSHVILGGDWHDFYALSRFEREPRRRLELAQNITALVSVLEQVRGAAGGARIIYLRGNHEYRLVKYLWTRAPELSGLPSLEVPELLQLKRIGIEWQESGALMLGGVLWKHGHKVRQKSGYSVTGEVERAGVSVVMGHVHRLGLVCRRTYAGMVMGVEAGCLCDLSPEYMEGQIADWQQGIAVGEVASGRPPTLWPLPIIGATVRMPAA